MNKTLARRMMKAMAMKNMQGNWLRSFVLFLISIVATTLIIGFLPIRTPFAEELMVATNPAEMLMLFVPKTITYKTIASVCVTAVLYLLVAAPLSVGICRFFLKVARGEKALFSDAFSPFASLKTVFSSVWLYLLVLFISAFWSFLLWLIPIAVMFLAIMIDSWIIGQISLLLGVAVSIFAVLWTSRYTFATYILAEGKSGGAFSSLRECIRLMHYRSGEAMKLRASYFGWDIAGSLFPPLNFIYNALFSTVYAEYLFYLRGELSFEIGQPSKDV